MPVKRGVTKAKEDHMKTIWSYLKEAYTKPAAPIAIGLMVGVLARGGFVFSAIPLRSRIARVATADRLNDLWCIHIPITSALLGFAVGFAVWFVRRAILANSTGQGMPAIARAASTGLHSQSPPNAGGNSGSEFLLKAVVPVAAAAFFFYQVIAGSYFAGTTVTLQGSRCLDKILVSVTLERGDNWLVSIPADEYHIGPVGADFDTGWKPVGFQRKKYGDLRLAPKEKTTTMFLVEPSDAVSDTTIVVAVDSYAMYWPMPSQSFAKLIVPAPAKTDDSLKCSAVSNAKEAPT
jgi:hypothetical protein